MATSSFLGRADGFNILERKARPKISIDLAGQRDGVANSYTTLDQIEGEVTITVDRDVTFDKLEITFEGSTETALERPGTIVNYSNIFHRFLTLDQPIDSAIYPESNTFRPGHIYRFPFIFVVSDRLLPTSCTHPKRSWSLYQAHTALPPTFGDPIIIDDHSRPLDDLSPPMTRIFYLLKATITKESTQCHDAVPLAAVGKKVRIIPTVDEDPPLSVADDSSEYRTRKETTVKRGLSRQKAGRLTLSALQPRPIQLELSPNNSSTHTSGTVATLNLRFVPITTAQPPQLDTLSSRIKVLTFLGVEPMLDFPTNCTNSQPSKLGRRTYQQTIPLLSLQVSSVRWEKHGPFRYDRDSFPLDVFYTASIVIPATLPSHKAFVPTFHSCFVSRVYVLELALSYLTLNKLKKTTSIKIPVQITCRKE